MQRRHPMPAIDLPTTWLFTDPRMGDGLWRAIACLPPGSGIVLRHYNVAGREALARRIAAEARRRGQLLVIAGDSKLAHRVGAAGTHLPGRGQTMRGTVTASAHDRAGIVRARRAGAALVFLSPIFATSSHPKESALGVVRFGLMARAAGIAVAALGGMTPARFRRLLPLGAAAWGAIDAWLED